MNFEGALNDNDLHVKQQLVWVKNAFILSRSDYKWKHELCLYGWKEGCAHYFAEVYNNSTVIEDTINVDKMTKDQLKQTLKLMLSDKEATTIIHENKPVCNDLHPTMKPLTLIGNLIKNSSQKDEIVLDLFGGSGSTMIACEQLNRICYTMEYDPTYAEVIIDRYEKYTGKKAIKL